MRGFEAISRPVRVLHVIPSLAQGGAEAMLSTLLTQQQEGVHHSVVTLLDAPQHFPVQAPVFRGRGRRGRPSPDLLVDVRRAVQDVRPDVVHGWMYHANLLTLAALGGGARVIWSIHSLCPRTTLPSRATRYVSATCALLSRIVPQRIVYVAQSSRERHEAAGYAADRGIVIPNGVDLHRFDVAQGRLAAMASAARLRIGVVGRYEPAKGQHFLVEALSRHPLRDQVELVFAGQGCDTAPELRRHLAATGLLDRTTLRGAVVEMPEIYAGLDLLVVPSFTEALPLAVLEAAAMGITICAARVGDIPALGLPPEVLFEPGDAEGFAKAFLMAAALARSPGEAMRQRSLIAGRFDAGRIAALYADLYRSLLP